MARLRIRIDFDPAGALTRVGPGKIDLLERISETGSISAAGRAMGMSYRRAWLLVDNLNRLFRERAVDTKHGGERGGGAALTPFGRALVERFRAVERQAEAAAANELAALQGMVAADPALTRYDLPAEPEEE
jgi:molybdate transport system regulatory protein